MKAVLKKYFKILLYLAGLIAIALMINNYGIVLMLEKISQVSWYFIPILFVWLAVYLLNAMSWKFIINSKSDKVSFSKILGLTISGYAINYVTPFVSLGGEPYRMSVLGKEITGSRSAAAVLLYSMMHMYSHVWFWILGLIIMLVSLGLEGNNIMIIGCSVIFTGLLLIIFMSLFKKGFIIKLHKILVQLPLIGKILSEKHYIAKLEEIDVLISDFYQNDKSGFYKSLGFELVSRIVASFEFFLILKAIGINISFADAIYISAASSLIANIIFFIPMQLGVREGSLAFIIATLSLAPGLGLFVSLTTRIREIFWIAAGFLIIPILNKRTGA